FGAARLIDGMNATSAMAPPPWLLPAPALLAVMAIAIGITWRRRHRTSPAGRNVVASDLLTLATPMAGYLLTGPALAAACGCGVMLGTLVAFALRRRAVV